MKGRANALLTAGAVVSPIALRGITETAPGMLSAFHGAEALGAGVPGRGTCQR